MKITGSIRNRLIAAIFLGSLIPYFLGGAYLKSYTEAWLYNNSIENASQILHQVSETIDMSLISDMKQEVELLSSVEAVKNARYNLQNYTHFNRNTFHYTPGTVEKAIEEQFRLLKTSHGTVNFVFLGTADGGYMEYPRFQAVQAYEPRLRPWYLSTAQENDIVISEPYLTKITNEMVVSFTKQIRDDHNSVVGVLGVTVNLFDLTTKINNIKIGNSGYILLLSPENKILVSPYHPEWIMKTPEELGLVKLNALDKPGEVQFETGLDNKECVLNSVVSQESGWRIVSVMDKDEMLQKARSVAGILLIIYAMILVMTFIVVFLISKRFTRPILEISAVVSRMTDFDFSYSAGLKRYAKQKDEIGTVASAMVEMHDNYTEFIDQVKYIDKRIRNINIEKNELLKAEISEKNPFHGVIESMNVLLGKINQNFNQLKETNREIHYLALHDPLTKLPNRRQFIDLLTEKLQGGKKGAVLLLDLDDFKGINDTLGHVFGDRVIEAIAKRLAEIEDYNVVVSRFGGDEFLVLMERWGGPEELDLLTHKIRDAFSTNVQIDNNDIEIRFSMGISLFPEDGTDVNQLIMNADLAMYSVKNAGKNAYKYFNNSMMNSQINKSKIEILLRDAIENDGFHIVYQPQIDLKTGEIHGYEALLRLKNSDISPSEFIPIAEINGSIVRIGRIVTEKVIRQLSDWKAAGLELKPVSINFSANQIHDSGYLRFIGLQLKKFGIDPGLIGIEITESISLESRKFAQAFLKKLKEMGFSISIDDFGAGYSSLNYLTFLPADKIKLDRVLNEKFLEIGDTKVMSSLISLVHSLGLTVIAEGIETQIQVERLKAAGCDIIQGYYYSVPLDPEQIPDIHHGRFS